jgi:hypothetical protein
MGKNLGQLVSSGWSLAATGLECAGKRLATPPKVSDVNLGYLASHARIAIHIGEFSSAEVESEVDGSRNKIAQSGRSGLKSYRRRLRAGDPENA